MTKTIACLCFSAFFLFSIVTLAEEFTPVKPWEPCNFEDLTFNYSTSDRTQWTINELYAIPENIGDPSEWEGATAFAAELAKKLPLNPDPAAYAKAVSEMSQDFAFSPVKIVINLKRNFSQTVTPLQCISGTWVPVSTQTTDKLDVSGWLDVGVFDVFDDSNALTLQQNLEILLNNINTQPGACANTEGSK